MPVVLISGGSGLIGTNLTRHLTERGYHVIILSRSKKESKNPLVSYSIWNWEKEIIDPEVVKQSDHIIHLAGAGVMDKSWSNDYKKLIIDSRTKSCALIIKALKENKNKVKTFVSASAIGYYGPDANPIIRKDGFIETDVVDKDFLGETCLLWEAAAEKVKELGIRCVKLRTGIALSTKGGALKEYLLPLRFGVAPILGNGKQVVSWIHIDDLARLYLFAIEDPYLNDSYNATAPVPITQKQLVVGLAEKLRHKFYTAIHVPAFLLKLFFGKRSIELLKSATVNDKKIKSAGFTFLYPTIESAIDELVSHK
jgi:uncharacterized protein (TIGR01777 family)